MNPQQIIAAVSEITGVTVEEMKSLGRPKRKVFARTLAIHEIRNSCMGHSLQDIGDLFDMDHANIAHSLIRHRKLMATDPLYQRAARKLSEMNPNNHTQTA